MESTDQVTVQGWRGEEKAHLQNATAHGWLDEETDAVVIVLLAVITFRVLLKSNSDDSDLGKFLVLLSIPEHRDSSPATRCRRLQSPKTSNLSLYPLSCKCVTPRPNRRHPQKSVELRPEAYKP